MGLAFAKKLPNYSFPWNIILIYIKKKIEAKPLKSKINN